MGNKIFNADNPFNRFMSRVFDIIALNLLWMLCCIPIITIGASTIALYSMTLKLVRNEEGSLTKGFFKAFRENFKQSIPVTLVFFFLYTLCLFNLYSLFRIGERTNVPFIAGNLLILAILTAIWVWIIPLIARYENPLPVHFNNAWRLAVGRLPYTLTFMVTTAIPFVWLIFSINTFIYVFPLWFLLGGGAIAAINSFYLRKVFDGIEGIDESEAAENDDESGE